MRKLFLLVFMTFISSLAFAQSGKLGIGVNIGYGAASDLKKPSIGIKANYDITKLLTIAPSFNYYFQKKESYDNIEAKLKVWDLNCDVHFNLLHKENFRLYPLAGISYLHAKATASTSIQDYGDFEGSASDGKVGANLGVGAQFKIASHFVIAPEVKYQIISDLNQLVPSVAVMYKF